MAAIQGIWTRAQASALVVAALFVGWGSGQTALGQATGSIAGRLTDLQSTPLGGATVVVRNEATGTETRTTTARNGSYRLMGLGSGEYTLEAESEHIGRGRLEGIFVAAGHEAHVLTAMQFELPPPRTFKTANRVIDAESAAVTATLAAEPLRTLPLGGRAWPELPTELPPVESPLVTAAMTAEPLQTLSLTGRHLPSVLRETPAVGSLVVFATLPAEPMQMFALIGQTWVGERSLSLTEAGSRMVQAALQFSQLQISGSQRDTVAAARHEGDPVTSVVSSTVTGAQLQALPVSGRRWQDFALDVPTASTAAGGAAPTLLRGAGQEPVETTVDGAGTRLAFGGQSGGGQGSPGSDGQNGAGPHGAGRAWAGGHEFAVAEAAIREVQTVAGNVEAEGARAAGGRMNVDTVRGANGLHGQGFLFDRQNTWGAQNPFTQWVKETTPATEITTPVFTPESYTPPDHETAWGIGAGSQIRRNKLFWFAALDSYRRNDPGLATAKIPDEFFAQPSNDQMQVLSARLGLSSSNPVAEGLAAYSKMLELLDGLLGPAPRTATQWLGFTRIDWNAAERHRFSLEGIGGTWDSPGGGLTRVSENYGNHSFGLSKASEEWLLGRWEAFLTPNLLAVAQGSMGRNVQSARPGTPSPFEQAFLSPSVWGQLPQIVVDSRYGFTIGNPSRFGQGSYPDERLYHAQESVDWVRGSLLAKAGFDVGHNSDATGLLRNQTGTYSYSSAENFASDALAFAAFGIAGQLNPANQHDCDETGKVWRDTTGQLRGLGYLPCYAYYSQVIGPGDWHLSTNEWAGFVTTQWQPKKLLVFSAGLRWEREQLPPPIASLANPQLPLTEKLPNLGDNWGPRVSLALGNAEAHWPVLRLGYGMYFGSVENATVETALTQTGSLKGDLNFFLRPTDNLNAGGAPPFPYVLAGTPASVVKPGAVEFASNFRNPEIHQAVAALEEELPGHMQLTASAMMSLGRRLPVYIDTNIDTNPADTGSITYAVKTCPYSFTGYTVTCTGTGPVKTEQITVPFYASWPSATESTGDCPTPFIGWLNPCYQAINQITSKANSTYEAAVVKIDRFGRRGLSLHAHYTYSHAMDWNPNESPLDPNPANFSHEYGTSGLDIRHAAAATLVYETPWRLHNMAGWLGNGWTVSGIAQFRSGQPYTARVSGSLPECGGFAGSCTPPQSSKVSVTTGDSIVGLGPGMLGAGGDNRVYDVGRNTYRYPATWKADMRLGKSFDLGHLRQLELLAESFNLFNHQNVTELETTGYYLESGTASSLPTLNFLNTFTTQPPLTSLKTTTAFGQPLNVNATNFYRERQVQVGLRMRF